MISFGSTRPTVENCLLTGHCTFNATGPHFHQQEVYRCITCNLLEPKGVCSVCAQKCHYGHKLIPSGKRNFYCDCNTRGWCMSQTVVPAHASVQVSLPGISISTNAPPMMNPYPQPTVVHQQVHHQVTGPTPYPAPQPSYPPPMTYPHPPHHSVTHVSYTSQISGPSVPCPVCLGKGGYGAFGPCHRGDVHWKRDCPFCKGAGTAMPGSRPCTMCHSKGGLGSFGPCQVDDVHFNSVCYVCHGKCHLY